MKVIDGRGLAKQILQKVAAETANLLPKPALHVIMVGYSPASGVYIRQKEKAANKAGVDFLAHSFPAQTNEKILSEFIEKLNRDSSVSGFFIQLPLPRQFNTNYLVNLINPKKDVDCLTAENLGLLVQNKARFLPATAVAVETILKKARFKLKGAQVVIVGRSRIAGLPIALQALHQNATVTICHRQTKNLKDLTKQADLLISAVGKPGLIKAAIIKKGAGVIDIGWARINGKPKGDVDPRGLGKIGSFYTPVPGGVGPVTVACLLKSVLMAHQNMLHLPHKE
jgi:methylenetetrahydrofolate dehydrogenase (NADP+)/methenyltetrahydrofolate cyclohydrolase